MLSLWLKAEVGLLLLMRTLLLLTALLTRLWCCALLVLMLLLPLPLRVQHRCRVRCGTCSNSTTNTTNTTSIGTLTTTSSTSRAWLPVEDPARAYAGGAKVPSSWRGPPVAVGGVERVRRRGVVGMRPAAMLRPRRRQRLGRG